MRAALLALAACGSTTPPPAPGPRPVAPADAAPLRIDALPPHAPPPDAAPPAVTVEHIDGAKICLQRIEADFAARHVDFNGITSVKNVRVRIGAFGRLCGNEFPLLAPAAAAASTQGIAGRRRIFGALVHDACPAVATAKSGHDVVAACPAFVGDSWRGVADAFLRRIDSGTFVFATLLAQAGFGTFAAELALQATMHPELDR